MLSFIQNIVAAPASAIARSITRRLFNPSRHMNVRLSAYWVGDEDIFAAYSAQDALEQARYLGTAKTFTLSDITELTAAALASESPMEGEARTLAELLANTRKPGWIAGYWR